MNRELLLESRAGVGIACVAGVRRGREKGSSSAKRDRGIGRGIVGLRGFPPPPPHHPPPRSRFALELPFSLPLSVALRARTRLLPSPSNAGHAG